MAFKIPYSVARQISDHAADCSPEEACGLLAGRGDQITAVFPLPNIASEPLTRFYADPSEQLRALRAIDEAGLDWLGVYHSHPNSAPLPSDSDIRECAVGGLLQLIVSLEDGKPKLKLWRIQDDSVAPLDLAYDTVDEPENEEPLSQSQQAALLIVAIAAVLILLLISFTLLPPAPELVAAP